MTPPDDKQGNNPDNSEFQSTLILMRCNKHGVSYHMGENCPECEKEKKPTDKDGAS